MRVFVPVLLFLSLFLPSVYLSPYIGPSWDEPDNIFAAGVYVRFFQEGFKKDILLIRNEQSASTYGDRIYSQNTDLERYPPFPLFIGALVVEMNQWFLQRPLEALEIIRVFHIVSGMFLAVGAIGIYALVHLLGYRKVTAVTAGLIFGLLPLMFGHGLSTIKDSAQVSLFIWSIYFMVRFFVHRGFMSVIFGGIIWGAAMATKFNAVYIPIIWLFTGISLTVVRSLKERNHISFINGLMVELKQLFLGGLGFVGIGMLTFVAVWPYLWFDTFNRIGEVIGYFTTVGQGYQVAWNAKRYMVGAGQSQFWYPLVTFISSTPILVLLFAIVGIVMIVYAVVTTKNQKSFQAFFLLLFWIGVPLIRIFSPTAAFYDGFRHFLEILPAIAVLTAIGTQGLVLLFLSRFAVSRTMYLLIMIVVPVVIIGQLIIIQNNYFPYSSGFMNSFVGKANHGYDREFSGLAIKEGMEYLTKTYPSVSVWVPIAGHLSWYFVRPGIDTYVYGVEQADSIVYINKFSHSSQGDLESLFTEPFEVEQTIARGDQVFGWVYRRVR